ncbi:MAG: hypothetical protein RIB59_08150 [Rhodospirillales bacterium]|jgi:hypothetical protein
MATSQAQKKWRDKHRLVKKQLNVMARKSIHDDLERFASEFRLRGKAEAVSFACFVIRGLLQRADYNKDVGQMLKDFHDAYHRDREIHSP